MVNSLTPNNTNEATQSALDAVMFVEVLESILKDFKVFTASLPLEYRQEAQVYLGKLESLYQTLDNEEFDYALLNNVKTLSTQGASKIQRMGVARQILDMRDSNQYTQKQLAERFGISVTCLRTFLNAYDKSKPSEKARLKKRSIYEIQDNMESLHSMLLRTISRFELDGEINNRNLAEYRQLIALAQKQLKEFSEAQKLEKLATLIEDVLLKHCLPEARKEVMLEFQRIGLAGFVERIPTVTPKAIEADSATP